MLRGMAADNDQERVLDTMDFHYGDRVFRIKSTRSNMWQEAADRYEEKARAGGGWVDIYTETGGVTIYASPHIPAHFEHSRESESAYEARGLDVV